MRRVLISDILATSNLIAAFPKANWGTQSHQIIAQTEAAHRYFKRFGRAHPMWGDGSLAGRAGKQLCARQFDLNAPQDIEALGWFLSVLAAHKLTPKSASQRFAKGLFDLKRLC